MIDVSAEPEAPVQLHMLAVGTPQLAVAPTGASVPQVLSWQVTAQHFVPQLKVVARTVTGTVVTRPDDELELDENEPKYAQLSAVVQHEHALGLPVAVL